MLDTLKSPLSTILYSSRRSAEKKGSWGVWQGVWQGRDMDEDSIEVKLKI